ncbi:MraY family glycosyltransferase [Oceanobacillus massiliensis]|uniref:glycosyltransferase family 4 protein n=1 Tax=Oceanobacillus massiliensis TaxID=1465765 RepID=UPI00301A7DAF
MLNLLAFAICLIMAISFTPLIRKLAFRIGAVDQPNSRKVHTRIMPRLGGLAIILSFLIGFIAMGLDNKLAWGILPGAIIIALIGVFDDLYELSAKVKFGGQLIAAGVTVLGGIQIEAITFPFGDRIEFGVLAVPITIFWIVAITNAINLIDGLDGLAAGVSAIALLTISGLAISMGNNYVALVGILLLGSTVGFLKFNFYPAKIFMGDTGALFLGYMISILSIMGLFKSVTFFSLIVPVIILGVPLLDTFFAIVRRMVQNKPLASPDKLHLHHCLLKLGYTHKQTVILIYILSSLFSIAALIFTNTTLWGSLITLFTVLIMIELLVELTGLISENYRPILNLVDSYRLRK